MRFLSPHHPPGGSFLIADRSFPELPYIQIPFSEREIQESEYPDLLSSYNYWHHRSRFIAQQSIQRWLFRCPRCRRGLSFSSEKNLSYAVASLGTNFDPKDPYYRPEWESLDKD